MADERLVFNPDVPPPCIDPKVTVIAQYANSPNLLAYLNKFSLNLKACTFFNDFYYNVWNLDKANSYGLNIWGIIVGVTRTVKSQTGFFWGFNEETLLLARPYHDTTGTNDALTSDADRKQNIGNFRDLQQVDGEITFDDSNFKKLILAKAHANISNFTPSDINKILMILFGDTAQNHIVYVEDNLDMSMTIVFNWFPNTDEVAILNNAGILFKPAGVDLKVKFNI